MIPSGAPILTAAATRAAEQALFDAGTDPYAVMRQAGEGAAELIWRAGHDRPALVLCGPGNNGGDGFVIADSLRRRGVPVRVAVAGEGVTDSHRRARADWNAPVEDITTVAPATQIIDALFGIGLSRGLAPPLAARLGALAEVATHSYAVDVPSGVDSDSGTILSPCPHYGVCIALGVLKPAHVLLPSAKLWTRIASVPLGLPVHDASVRLLEPPRLHAPAPDSHKYRRGLVAVVAGRMAGAAALSAEAAARGGAGYVRVIGAQAILPLSHAIVRAHGDDEEALRDERVAALLVGPGLGREDSAARRLDRALTAGHPAVVDADGLLLLTESGLDRLPSNAILTPHDGEFAALFGELSGNRIDQTLTAAARAGAVVVRKGRFTIIAAPDGRARVADAASTWLSTAGTGDVLAGLCAARLAVTGDPFGAACEAVWLHGEAGRRAGPAFGADDLLPLLPAAIASRL